MLTDDQGLSVWIAGFQVLGLLQDATDAHRTINRLPPQLKQNQRFQGQYFDAETGLHYNRHRYYDPQSGRYLRKDPAGLSAGINAYVYAIGNPASFVDPTGLQVPGTWNTIFGGSAPSSINIPTADYVQVGYSGPLVGASLTVDRNLNLYAGIQTGCVACAPSPQVCIGKMLGKPMNGEQLAGFISGPGGQASAGQYGVGYGWAFSGGRTAQQITFGGLQAPGAGSGGYTWQIIRSGLGK